MTILLSIDAALLRAQLPQLVLRTGQAIAARVVERHGRYGIITIAGVPLSARLPDDVAAGDRLSLVVREASGERIVLGPAGGSALPPPFVLAPGLRERLARRAQERAPGGERRQREDDAHRGEGEE